jgi:hypothetical protein
MTHLQQVSKARNLPSTIWILFLPRELFFCFVICSFLENTNWIGEREILALDLRICLNQFTSITIYLK